MLAMATSASGQRTLPHPADGVRAALADAGNIPPDAALFQRYVWCPDDANRIGTVVALNFGMNRSRTLVRPDVLPGSIMRVDLLRFGGDIETAVALAIAWDSHLSDEPYFLARQTLEIKLRRVCVPYVARDGATYHHKTETIPVRIPAPHVPDYSALQQQVGSGVPIVRAEWLAHRLLSNDTGAGGRYYEFRGIRNANTAERKAGQTDWGVYTTSRGIAVQQAEALLANQQWATFRSHVTGRERGVVFTHTVASRPTVNQGLFVFTIDSFIGQTDSARNPVLTLLDGQFDGTEAILELPWGGLEFALFNGNGGLVRTAPDRLVSDRTVPGPHPTILQPGESCMRCHVAQSVRVGDALVSAEGWRELDPQNSVQALLAGYTDAFGSTTDGAPLPDTIQRLASAYAGDFVKVLDRARDDLSDAMTLLTGGVDDEIVRESWGFATSAHDAYWYEFVDAATACRDLGYDGGGVELFGELMGTLPPDAFGISPEDARIAGLRAGMEISRVQWELVYADAALRAMATDDKRLRKEPDDETNQN